MTQEMNKLRVISLLLIVALKYSKGQERRCDVPADVVFLMDASDSIKDTEWDQAKDFVSVLIDNLEVDRYAIHVGVIVYSTELGQVIDLQPFKTKTQLKTLLKQAAQINQGTDTAKAISKMIEMSEGQGRIEAGAKQIAVIITDGRSTNVPATIREARRARLQYHVEMIALGVGNETFLEELVEIAGPENTKRLFQVKDFAQLRDVVAQLQDLICEIIPATTTLEPTTPAITTTSQPTTSPNISPFPCSKPADVIFLIDGSYSISPSDWIKGKQFISYLINSIDIGVDSVHVGMIVYGSDIGDVVPLQPFKDKNDLKMAATDLIQPPVGRTNTALGLQRVRDMISSQARQHVPHILIVITDGMSSNPSETRDQAAMAKTEGVTIFVVGVGDRVLQQEVEEMASSPQSLFDAPDFKYLVGMVQLLRDNICTAIQVTSTPIAASPTSAAATTRPPIPELCKLCLVEGGVGFNPLPSDCEKYIICIPQGLTYEPHIKSCPFGMFWSSVAVSCLDARYVDCSSDKCKALPNSATYPSDSSNCRSYFSCSNNRSTPLCCEAGYTYVAGAGCSPDPSCVDLCPLNTTIYNEGSCRYRSDPDSYYSYLEVIPGQGHVKRLCDPGQVFSQKTCSCTFQVEEVISRIACTPALNLTFDGSFENNAPLSQPINVHGVDLTNSSTARFNGDSLLTLPATAGQEFGDNIVIKIKYRKGSKATGQNWTNHGDWGFEKWFTNASNNGNTHSIQIGGSEVKEPDTGRPTGAEIEPLEVITVTKNGTIIRDPRYDFKVDLPSPTVNQSVIDLIQLGNIGDIATPTIKNGIVLVPIGNSKVLVQESVGGPSGSVRSTWKIVSLNLDGQSGQVEETGQGTVPVSVQEKYGFDLRPSILEKWFILAPGGIVLQNGEGPIPQNVKNRYDGFTSGTLVKVFDRGGQIEKWQISKPDGSQQQEGQGSIPQNLLDLHKLDKVLSPLQTSSTWSFLASDGRILETGTGEVPSEVVQKYMSNPSVTVLKSTSNDGHDSRWEVTRPSGVKVIEGRGSFPQGISRFVQGDLLFPQISSINKWTVTMPDGTVRNGTGQIPQEILDLFQPITSSTAEVMQPGSTVINRWTITLPDGTVKTGEGPMPQDVKDLMNIQGSNVESRWQVTLPDGTVKSGVGDVPYDLMSMLQGHRTRRASRDPAQTVDLVSNCGTDPSITPSVHLFASDGDVTLTLVTSQSPTGVSLSLPATRGLNDVMFRYNGSHITGLVNGHVRTQPVRGHIQTRPFPLKVGECATRPGNHFVGDLDEVQIYFC